MKTIINCIQHCAAQLNEGPVFFGHGIDNPWDEAVQLVLHVMQLPLNSDKSVSHHPVNAKQWQTMQTLLAKRINQRIPLAYLIHEAWFMHQPFYVDERVLIPRSPFGEWLTKKFQPYINPQHVQRILEIGTGSGCMAIGAAWSFPHAQIDAVDISSDALAVAKINVEKYQLQARVHLIQADCFPPTPQRYDLIISNPPYVPEVEYQQLPTEFSHEPKLALTAENKGMAIVKRIIEQAPNYLSANGVLVIEVGASIGIFRQQFQGLDLVELPLEHGGNGLVLIKNN